MTLPKAVKNESSEETAENCSGVEIKVETYVCNDCDKKFTTESSLSAHMNSHNLNDNDLDAKQETRNTCSTCLKKFTAKKNLLKHLRDVHKNYSEAERMVIKKLKCPQKNCEFLCRMTRELRNHIEKCHKIKILKDTFQFPSEAVFQKWKKEEEMNTISWFVSGRKKTTLTDGTKKQTFYCHRTGHYNPKGFGKYRMRSVGSCKIGVTCPAAMEVTESEEGELSVIYYKTHLGHMPDLVYLKLTKEEKAHLEEKIKQGFSFDSILEDVKESKDVDNEKKKRIHLLSKRDLYRIMYRSKKSNKRKSTCKELSFVTLSEQSSQSKISQKALKKKRKESLVTKVQPKRTEERTSQAVPLPTSHSSRVPPQEPPTDNQSGINLCPQQTVPRDLNIPQTPTEVVTSQIVILPPQISYVPEIIFLSANDAVPAQPETILQNKPKAPENQRVQGSELQTPISGDIHSEHLTKGNKSNFYLQLKEKLHKILEYLPQSEDLTPRQFNLINTKLDGILDIFSAANEKAKMRKNSPKKSEVKRTQTVIRFRSANGGNEENLTKNQVQQQYEGPLIYAVYN